MAANPSASCAFACSTIDHNAKKDHNINQMHIDLLGCWVGDWHSRMLGI
jgi:hypothetical protein